MLTSNHPPTKQLPHRTASALPGTRLHGRTWTAKTQLITQPQTRRPRVRTIRGENRCCPSATNA
eukprot:8163730-Heterocapsa_arctica.AAC.1